jgi:ATP-dependent Lon protease
MNTRLKRKMPQSKFESDYSDDPNYSDDHDDHDDHDDNYYNDSKKKTRKQIKDNPFYKKICDKIKIDEPDINKILNNNFLIKDRVQLFQLYEIYQTTIPNSEQWLDIRNKYIQMYTDSTQKYIQHQQYSKSEHKLMNTYISNNTNSNEYTLKYKILQLKTNDHNKQIIFNKYQDWINMSKCDDEWSKLQQWLQWAVEIPHDNIKTISYTPSQTTNFLIKVKEHFDKQLYGMDSIKEQILLFLNSKMQNPNMKKCSLGLIGPSGVGKTKIARLLAEIMDFPFEQISLGGITSPHILKGHPYTYVGAQPGEIVKCLKRMKYKNGILFMDEYEKISHESNLCAALLHMTDSSQNFEYRDNYLSDITIDLSNIWFIYSMNSLPTDTALRDRIFDIYVSGYTIQEKYNIVSDHLLPKALENINRHPKSIQFINKKACMHLIKKIEPNESLSGVRLLEKNITSIVNKIDFLVHHNIQTTFSLPEKLNYPLKLDIETINSLLK